MRKFSFPQLLLMGFIFIYLSPSYSQKFEFAGKASFTGLISNQDRLPFWLHSNRRGRVTSLTTLSGLVSARAVVNLENLGVIELGGGLNIRDEHSPHLFFDEAFATYSLMNLKLTIGRKHRAEKYHGLSSSNESILWSLNSRALPQIGIETIRPVLLNGKNGFGFELTWREYRMENERFIKEPNLHNKSFHLVYINSNWFLKAGLRHFVQWGGKSPKAGRQPDGLEDYLRIITGRGGRKDANWGDQTNALGNHLGGYEINIKRNFPQFSIELIYNHVFEDKSGMLLGNTPDGRYGIFVDRVEKEKWVNSLMYEFYYTKHQSSTTSGSHIYDNYFNNFLYRSGWTYHQQVIGSPFFTPNFYEEEHSGGFIRVGNNFFTAHHIGISGIAFNTLPYKLKTSYRRNYGHYRIAGEYLSEYYPPDDERARYKLPEQVLSVFADVKVFHGPIDLNLLFGGDFSSQAPNIGIGINLQRRF